MKFRYTILYVENVADTIVFYKKAFGFETLFLHESGDYAELTTGDTKLAFSSISLMQSLGKSPAVANRERPTFEIAFETDHVKESLDRALSAGATLVQPAEEMEWGQTTAYVNDINGFLVEICSTVS